jgi:uncharacterized protein (DUF2236 family)
MEAIGQSVSRRDIERLWDSIRDQTSDPQPGIFGPSSISWKVNRESALFLGAGRAALLQLAHTPGSQPRLIATPVSEMTPSPGFTTHFASYLP